MMSLTMESPAGSDADPETVTVLLPNLLPLLGLRMATVGGAVLVVELATFTVMGADVPLLLAASTATAVSVAAPSGSVAEFQTKLYGVVVSEATS